MRITQKHLQSKVDTLNRVLGLPVETYTKVSDAVYKSNVGNIHLDKNIGGWQICQITNDGGGVCCPFGYYRGKAEVIAYGLEAAIAAASGQLIRK